MDFHCDECGRQFRISDDKVRGKAIRVRCPKCRKLVVVTGPADSKAESTAAPMLFHPAIVRDRFRNHLKPAFEKLDSILASDEANAKFVHQWSEHFVKEVRDLDEMVAKWAKQRA